MKRSPLLITLLALVLVATPVSGAMIRGGEQLTIDDAITDDLYIGGGQVTVAQPVTGDLVGAGGEVHIEGNIKEDVTLAGGRIYLDSTMDDDVRIAGGEVRITGTVKDDLFVAGGRVELEESAVVNGDVRIAGGEVFIDGSIAGDLDVRGGRLVLRGDIAGNVDAAADQIESYATIQGTSRLVAEKIVLGSEASFAKDVTYWQREDTLNFKPAMRGDAKATFDPSLARKEWNVEKLAPKVVFWGFVGSVLSSLLFAGFFIMVLALLTKTMFADAAKQLRAAFWQSALYGFLYFIVTPIVVLILLVSVVGIPVSLFSGVLYGFSIYFAKPLTAMVIAQWIEVRHKRKWGYWPFVGMSILMFLGLKLLGCVPLVGWVICLLLVCAAFGALMVTKWQRFQKAR